MKKILWVVLTLVLVALSACSSPPTAVVEGIVLQGNLQSEQSRVIPAADNADIPSLIKDNNEFALELFQELRSISPGENLFYSPLSISEALAMVFAGARGETASQMAETLNFNLEPETLYNALNWLEQHLIDTGNTTDFRLSIANAIWGQNGYPIMPEYLDILARYFGAGLRGLDFAGDAEISRKIINDWVSTETAGRIPELLGAGSVNALTRIILTNAIYFDADWQSKFTKESTREENFYLLDNTIVRVLMMSQTGSFKYADGVDYRAVELPYAGSGFSMVIMMPEQNKFEEFENSLDIQKLDGIIESLSTNIINLKVPKFEFSCDYSLKEILSRLGMPDAFSGSADFSGMCSGGILIDDVVHKAFVSVDEEGTEAAAATGIIMIGSSPDTTEPINVTIDHPFIFFIRDVQTGAIIFLGRVMNPILS